MLRSWLLVLDEIACPSSRSSRCAEKGLRRYGSGLAQQTLSIAGFEHLPPLLALLFRSTPSIAMQLLLKDFPRTLIRKVRGRLRRLYRRHGETCYGGDRRALPGGRPRLVSQIAQAEPGSAQSAPGQARRAALDHLSHLLKITQAPRWATPALIALGLGSSFAETLGITLIILFFYSAMGQLDQAASVEWRSWPGVDLCGRLVRLFHTDGRR